MTGSLILAAHGSAGENANRPMFDLADQISRRHRFHAVTPAFLSGEPNLVNVLEQLPVGRAVVVPMMTSAGYYHATIRDQLSKNRNRDAFEIAITRVFGSHESLPLRISQRITHYINQYQMEPSNTSVVVIGHGTRRNPNSCRTTLTITERLIDRHPGLTIEAAFLDQSPELPSVAKNIKTPHVLLIPFLIGRGPHATIDIPAVFGLPTGTDIGFPIVGHRVTRQQKSFGMLQNRSSQPQTGYCICDSPVGLYPDIDEICMELVQEQMNREPPTSLSTQNDSCKTPAHSCVLDGESFASVGWGAGTGGQRS